MKNLMIILIGSIFAGIIAQIVMNMAGYNSKKNLVPTEE